MNDPQPQLEIFFDGECPICRREIRWCQWLDRRRQRIRFIDIASRDFVPAHYGKTMDEFMAEMHGRLSGERWLRGVETFRHLYAALGASWIVRISRLPLVASGLERSYRVFAKYRLRWARKCQRTCQS